MFYGGVAAGKAAIDGGSVKPIAVTGDTRSTALPNVPTFKEAGVPEFDLASWTVMLAPKGTPAEIVSLIRKETLAALDDPKTREALAKQGVEPSPTQDVRAFLVQERECVRPRGARARPADGGVDDDRCGVVCCSARCSSVRSARQMRRAGRRGRSSSSCRPGPAPRLT